MPNNENKKNIIEPLIEIFRILFKYEKKLTISILFSFTLTFIVLKYSNIFILNTYQALSFMTGIILLFLFIYYILTNKTKYNFQNKITNLFSIFFKIEKCDICNCTMNIRGKNNSIYYWYCKDHKDNNKKVQISCPACNSNTALISIKNHLYKCNNCLNLFKTSDINFLIEKKYKYYITDKLPRFYSIDTRKFDFNNVIFLTIYSVILSIINYLLFQSETQQLIASLFHTAKGFSILLT